MNNEQNIEDFLKLLKESVNNPVGDGEIPQSAGKKRTEISPDALQKKLRAQYKGNGVSDESGSYELDEDFLREFAEADDAENETENEPDDQYIDEMPTENANVGEMTEEDEGQTGSDPAEEYVSDQDDCEESHADVEISSDIPVFETKQEAEAEEALLSEPCKNEGDDVDVDISDDDIEDTSAYPSKSDNYSSSVVTLSVPVDDETVSEDELFGEYTDDDRDVIESQTDIDDELTENGETSVVDEADEEAETEAKPVKPVKPVFNEYSAHHESKPISFKALMMDYGRPDPTPKEIREDVKELQEDTEEDTPDIGDLLSDFADDTPTSEERVNTSMQNLMSSLGCEDELRGISTEALGEVYGDFADPDAEQSEGVSAEKAQRIKEGYKKNIFLTSLRLAACGLLGIVILLYDTLPIFDVDFFGIIDYVMYPGAYVLVGLQLMLLSCVCLWRQMWEGIKRLTTPYPNIYSMAAALALTCTVYDLILLLTDGYDPIGVPVFHFMVGAVMFTVLLSELIMLVRESRNFDLYSSDVARFTLSTDKSKNSVAGKMYAGGFSKDKRVFMPSAVSYPKGFFDAMEDVRDIDNKVMSALLHVSAFVGILSGIILLILDRPVLVASASAMSLAVTLVPTGVILGWTVPALISNLRLTGRGIALTGKKMIKKYGSDNAIVFNDLHLFSKCEARNVGFVCYESAQTNNVLAALQILYSRIGGPMCDVFANVPEQYRAKRIRVRRITRSGVEAVIDKSHVLVVGDIDFLRRYGIEFLNTETSGKNKSNATLYISYDGKASAKLSAKYTVEPVFDMLIERLSAEGVHCVIETYDPMINTAFVASLRKKGRAPISVVHKNAADINRTCDRTNRNSDHGILAVSSRLKLAEAMVWCSRICRIEKIINVIIYSAMGLGALIVCIMALIGAIPCFIQHMAVLGIIGMGICVLVITLSILPRKNYFTVSALEKEYEAKLIKKQKKEKINE